MSPRRLPYLMSPEAEKERAVDDVVLGRCLQRTHFFFFFFFFSPKLSYVPFVLARDHLGKLEMEK